MVLDLLQTERSRYSIAAARAYRLCTRCVMDTSDHEITFDKEGRCGHCTEFLNIRAHSFNGVHRMDLDSLIADIKDAGAGRAYDCVLGLSGGVDSSYLA